jgi:glycosyltransferase involved in cell wall biosynthesis
VEEVPKLETGGAALLDGKRILLSINRFERKKNVSLAIRAYANLSSAAKQSSRLVIAGKDANYVVGMLSADIGRPRWLRSSYI